MKNPCFILILYCGLVSACNSSRGDPTFPREETLSQELMLLQGVTYPIRVEVKHPFLIFQNMKMNDSIFHIYDLTSGELKSTFGKTGEGPGEFILPWMIQTPFSDILIFDKESFYRFDINEKGQPVFKEAETPAYEGFINNRAFINDSTYVVDFRYAIPELHLLTMQDEQPKKTWTYRNPAIMDPVLDSDDGNVYANESRIVFCYGYKKQIDFMDTEFNLIKRVKFDYAHPTEVKADGDDKVSYTYGYLGKRYLYASFFGTSWKENRANSTCGTFLEVFDLDGNPVARYHLEGRRPVYFAVDEETFTLYGTGEDGDPEDNLLVYKLKGLS